MNLFTLLVVLALGAGTVMALICILCFGREKSWKLQGILLAACCIPLPLCIAGLVRLSKPSDLSGPAELRAAYQLEFAEPPTPDVLLIQCRRASEANTMSAWMCFRASPETVDRLLRRFTPCDRFQFSDLSQDANSPSWWQPETANLVYFYQAEKWRSDFGGSEAVLAHDAAKSLVYFHHIGVD